MVDGNVEIGRGSRLQSGVILSGWTRIGQNNQISHGAVIGTPPQDAKYRGEETYVRIGDNNIIREYVTIHRAAGAGQATVVGDGNMLMAYVHIAHNCILGNEVTIANSVGLSGHVEIEDQATIGGYSGVHQFVRIGRLAMIGGYSRVVKDIPPYAVAVGQPARLYGTNYRGMRRRNIPPDIRSQIKSAFKIMAQSGLPLAEAVPKIKESIPASPALEAMLNFLETRSRMGVLSRNIRGESGFEQAETGEEE